VRGTKVLVRKAIKKRTSRAKGKQLREDGARHDRIKGSALREREGKEVVGSTKGTKALYSFAVC